MLWAMSDPDPSTAPKQDAAPRPVAGPVPPFDPDRWGTLPPSPVVPPVVAPAEPSARTERGSRGTRLALLAAALAAAGAIAAAVVVSIGGGSPGPSPTSVVHTYLADLAAGNASGALAQGRPPRDTTFLTADVLRSQQRIAAITGVRIASSVTNGGTASVRATYRFGDRSADATFTLTHSGGRWRLDQTTVQIDVSTLTTIPAPTVFDRPIGAATTIEVFPGPVQWGSANRYFQVVQQDADRFALSPTDPDASYTELSASLDPAGHAALLAAVEKYVAGCAASTSLSPAHCPQQQFDDHVVPGSVRWQPLGSLASALSYRSTDQAITTLEATARLLWRCSYRVRAGGTVVSRTQTGIEGDVDGTVDMTAATPTFTAQ